MSARVIEAAPERTLPIYLTTCNHCVKNISGFCPVKRMKVEERDLEICDEFIEKKEPRSLTGRKSQE